MFKLYLMDLLPEKRKEFLEAHGCWDVDVEDPSTFPNNWDIFPIMTFDPDDSDIYYEQDEDKKFDSWWETYQELNNAYQEYLRQWYVDHSGPEFEGMEPVCFNEFIHNDYLEEEY